MIGMRKSELQLVPHDPLWRSEYEAEKNRIIGAAGDDVRVEHVGSTAIESIRAKPVLDIAILCSPASLDRVANAVESLGYKYRGKYDDQPDRYYAVLDEGDVRRCQLHIYTRRDAGWTSQIMFRDALGKHRHLAEEYERYKVMLAATTGNDKREYARIKSLWADEFVRRVLAW